MEDIPWVLIFTFPKARAHLATQDKISISFSARRGPHNKQKITNISQSSEKNGRWEGWQRCKGTANL